MAAHLREAGRTVQAAALIDGALAYSPGAITLHLAAADLLMSEGDWEGANQRMRTGFRVVPDGAARLVEALLPRLAWIDSPHLMGYLFELEEFRAAIERAVPSDTYEPGSYHLAKARLHGLAARTEQARAHYDSARLAAAAGVEEQRRVGRPQEVYRRVDAIGRTYDPLATTAHRCARSVARESDPTRSNPRSERVSRDGRVVLLAIPPAGSPPPPPS